MRQEDHLNAESLEIEGLQCDFCSRPPTKENKLLAATDVSICQECVEACSSTIGNWEREQFLLRGGTHLLPKEIVKALDKRIIGQERAKKSLAIAVYSHYKRVNGLLSKEVNQKSNILMIGSSGTGKTLLAQTLASLLNVPFSISDATSLTEAGYVGDDVENVLFRLVQAAHGDINAAEKGIVFIDEIDKLARRSTGASITRDVSGEGVQQALLKVIEGALVSVPVEGGRKHPQGQNVQIDTTDILFICGGAFTYLDQVISGRKHKKVIGFTGESAVKDPNRGEILKEVLPEDLLEFGLIPEFIGRIPIIATLDNLDKLDLIRILTEPENALVKHYQELVALDNVSLDIKPEALSLIAEHAIEKKTGARGLRATMEYILHDILFEAPDFKKNKKSKKITIDETFVRDKLGDLS